MNREHELDHGRQIVPSPIQDLEIREVGLQEFMNMRGGMNEFLGSTHHREGWAFHQVKALEDAVCAGF